MGGHHTLCGGCHQEWLSEDAVVCTKCGHVRQSAPAARTPVSNSRPLPGPALRSVDLLPPPDSSPGAVSGLTAVTGVDALGFHGVPERVAGVVLEGLLLTPFEGYLLSLMDGRTNADDVVAASGLAVLDAARSLLRLRDMGVIRFLPALPKVGRPVPVTSVVLTRPDGTRRAVTPAPVEFLAAPPAPPPTPPPTPPPVPVPAYVVMDAAAHLEACRTALVRGDYPVARRELALAAAAGPLPDEGANWRAFLEDPARAPERSAVLAAMAAEAEKNGNAAEGARLYRGATAEQPGQAALHFQAGVLLLRLGGAHLQALQELETAAHLDPANPMHLAMVTRVRAFIRKKEGAAP
ncbi:MAG: hypothetical protein HY904_18280 [Deltaproteobacteria bacterium]|nr:hypothetical protein [Deltaproteobacteria bacterium]